MNSPNPKTEQRQQWQVFWKNSQNRSVVSCKQKACTTSKQQTRNQFPEWGWQSQCTTNPGYSSQVESFKRWREKKHLQIIKTFYYRNISETSRNNALHCQATSPVTYLLSEMSERLSSSQVCEPVVYGTLGTCCHQPKVILLIHLGFPSSCVRQCIAPQLFCNNTAKIWADLGTGRGKGKKKWITGSQIRDLCA